MLVMGAPASNVVKHACIACLNLFTKEPFSASGTVSSGRIMEGGEKVTDTIPNHLDFEMRVTTLPYVSHLWAKLEVLVLITSISTNKIESS